MGEHGLTHGLTPSHEFSASTLHSTPSCAAMRHVCSNVRSLLHNVVPEHIAKHMEDLKAQEADDEDDATDTHASRSSDRGLPSRSSSASGPGGLLKFSSLQQRSPSLKRASDQGELQRSASAGRSSNSMRRRTASLDMQRSDLLHPESPSLLSRQIEETNEGADAPAKLSQGSQHGSSLSGSCLRQPQQQHGAHRPQPHADHHVHFKQEPSPETALPFSGHSAPTSQPLFDIEDADDDEPELQHTLCSGACMSAGVWVWVGRRVAVHEVGRVRVQCN